MKKLTLNTIVFSICAIISSTNITNASSFVMVKGLEESFPVACITFSQGEIETPEDFKVKVSEKSNLDPNWFAVYVGRSFYGQIMGELLDDKNLPTLLSQKTTEHAFIKLTLPMDEQLLNDGVNCTINDMIDSVLGDSEGERKTEIFDIVKNVIKISLGESGCLPNDQEDQRIFFDFQDSLGNFLLENEFPDDYFLNKTSLLGKVEFFYRKKEKEYRKSK